MDRLIGHSLTIDASRCCPSIQLSNLLRWIVIDLHEQVEEGKCAAHVRTCHAHLEGWRVGNNLRDLRGWWRQVGQIRRCFRTRGLGFYVASQISAGCFERIGRVADTSEVGGCCIRRNGAPERPSATVGRNKDRDGQETDRNATAVGSEAVTLTGRPECFESSSMHWPLLVGLVVSIFQLSLGVPTPAFTGHIFQLRPVDGQLVIALGQRQRT